MSQGLTLSIHLGRPHRGINIMEGNGYFSKVFFIQTYLCVTLSLLISQSPLPGHIPQRKIYALILSRAENSSCMC